MEKAGTTGERRSGTCGAKAAERGTAARKAAWTGSDHLTRRGGEPPPDTENTMLSLDVIRGNIGMSLALSFLLGSASLAGGCAARGEPCDGESCELDLEDGAEQDAEDAEDVGEAAGAVVDPCGGSHDVGVIPETLACPAGVELVRIYMDDEDTSNSNTHSGWIGATLSGTNTHFAFCRVNGDAFARLVTGEPYVVLKLDAQCPAGSQAFSRTFDNEDTGNDNSYTGNIYPSTSTKSPSQTTLQFCLFRGAGAMQSFPDFGFKYGVFSRQGMSRSKGEGMVFTDDEDTSNGNAYSTSWLQLLDPQATQDAKQAIGDGTNTLLRMARVN